MAQVYKKPQDPNAKPKRRIFPPYLPLVLGGVLLVIGLASSSVIVICISVFLFVLAGLVFLVQFIVPADQMVRAAGEAGENATAHIIEQLPEGYYGFRNLHIPYDGRVSEIDMVVVGPTGVYIIETKNLKGAVTGNPADDQWILHKTGRGGGSYQRSFYNPLKQVGTHVYRLAHFLRGSGCMVQIHAMVFFANEYPVQVYGQPGKFPVYSGEVGAKLIFQSILAGKDALSTQTIHRICQLLYPYL